MGRLSTPFAIMFDISFAVSIRVRFFALVVSFGGRVPFTAVDKKLLNF